MTIKSENSNLCHASGKGWKQYLREQKYLFKIKENTSVILSAILTKTLLDKGYFQRKGNHQ